MPGAIGWAPALLPSRGGVIAHPKVQSRNSDSARCDWEIEEVAEAALLPVALDSALRQARSPCEVQVLPPFQYFGHRGRFCCKTRSVHCLMLDPPSSDRIANPHPRDSRKRVSYFSASGNHI